jgi:hypothetical protein
MSDGRQRQIERAQGRLLRVLPMLEQPLTTAIDLEPGGRAVQSALAYLFGADGDPDALAMAREAAAEAHRQLDDGDAEEDALEAIRSLLTEAMTALREADQHPIDEETFEPSPLRASEGLPRLHRLDHELVTPQLRLPPSTTRVEPATFEPLAPPTTEEELESHGDRQRAHIRAHLDRVLAKDERGTGNESESESDEASVSGPPRFVEPWARQCLEDTAMLGSQRMPLPGDDWRASRELEARIVWNVDAFASLVAGPSGTRALDLVEAFVLDAPAPDPWRLFGVAMLLGSLAGRDTLGMVDRLARASSRDPESLSHLADALRVCPHPRLATMLRDWLEDSDPTFRTVAAEVLVAREALSAEELLRLTEDRREVAASALMPLALAGSLPQERAVELLDTAQRDDAIAALAVGAKGIAIDHLREQLDGDPGWAAPWLASLSGREDGERIVEHALRNPSAATLAACAVAGLPVVDRLMPLLSHDDTAIALSTAQALDRITGAGLRAIVEVPAEQLLVPDLPEPSTGGFVPLAAASDDTFEEPRGAHDRVELPPADAASWGAWWREHRDRFEEAKRYRRGKELSARAVWSELDGPWLDVEARRRVSVELLAMVGKGAGFDLRDFVVRQEAALARWQSLIG